MTKLANRNDYLSAGVHIGMKEKNAHMDNYVFKRRPDGIAVLDIEKTDEKIKSAASLLSNYSPEKILVVSRKGTGHDAVKKFGEMTGSKYIVGRFLPGALTNPSFRDYFEADIIVTVDSSLDKQAMKEAIQRKIPIIALCNTNNDTSYTDLIIPTNNKGAKSISLILYLIAKELLKIKGEKTDITMKEFLGEVKEE